MIPPWHPARFALLVASGRAGLTAPIDGPSTEIRDAGGVAAQARAAAAGFTAKLCIHPHRVEPTAAAFAPLPEQVARAHAVVAAATGGVAQLDGQMVARPVPLRAEHVLARTGVPTRYAHPREEP